MKSRWRVVIDLTFETPTLALPYIHTILTERLADGQQISGLTLVDAQDLNWKQTVSAVQPKTKEATTK